MLLNSPERLQMKFMLSKLQPLVALNLFMAIAVATASESPGRGENSWQWTLQAGAVHQFESSLDSGGDMDASRFFVSGVLSYMLWIFFTNWSFCISRISGVLSLVSTAMFQYGRSMSIVLSFV